MCLHPCEGKMVEEKLPKTMEEQLYWAVLLWRGDRSGNSYIIAKAAKVVELCTTSVACRHSLLGSNRGYISKCLKVWLRPLLNPTAMELRTKLQP